ncbi:MAG: transketolase [Candidatus Gastranaerophilales bacterium]|nr:transketolase [Candidatus Gastranaerophilales bacterium]
MERKFVTNLRKQLVKMHQKGPHFGSALSAIDIISVLYFNIMNIPSAHHPDRDRFILSKGHSVSALYTVLAEKGFINKEKLDEYLVNGSTLFGHPKKDSVPGIEASTGSLGHGLPIASGMAIAAKNDKKNYKIFVLMGDGECQEGSIWEAAMLASRLKLDNLVVIIDANNLQGFDIVENVQPISTFKAKWEAFGWNVKESNGHDLNKLTEILSNIPFKAEKPSVLIAHTIKGKDIAIAENKMEWHYFSVSKDKADAFIEELNEKI